ncbi:CDP-glycerol glycerophosphotransferase family protein [Maribacter sp. ANRC-HE7]|uniref:CDP-glycerol glycerophosphotransferase family protein n=1 Tax=Maribacter aquimaris TaxID=2737171 RepID=A0ABR7V4G8_9FLAO|nr:CDP-glycerol glycerophosphotransferase family protein [Maribacter aquimaris]MBD0779699.1 CDP-glycerol glycerophosphotransferase family protein [Maribacter aquimaris]
MKRVFKYIKIVLKIIIGFPFYYISMVIPKKKELAVIGSSLGKHFADNTKYYYINYYSKEKSSLNLIWISKNRDVVKELKLKGLPAEYLYSFKGIYITLRASKAYLSHRLDDINSALIGGAKIIQLWHGMPLRKIGYGGDWTEHNLSGKIYILISKYFPYAYYMKCDILIAPCETAKLKLIEPFSKSFRNNKIADNIVLARQPRTLCFDNKFELASTFFPEVDLLKSLSKKHNKIISWLPTHRAVFNKSILDVILDSKLDLNKLNTFCKQNNTLFVIKAHFLDFNETSKIVQSLDFIYVYPHADAYPLLKYTDILITDYSSVFFDFLFLNRPIIFMSHDLEEYREKVNFYYNYENLNIGPICKSWNEVMKIITDISNNQDDYLCKREEAFNNYHFEVDCI